MRYLIDVFLRPNAHLRVELARPVEGRHYPEEFRHFTFNHLVNGVINAQGDDPDDQWDLIVVDNEVSVVKLPTLAERIEADPELDAAIATLRAAGVTPMQWAQITGQDY